MSEKATLAFVCKLTVIAAVIIFCPLVPAVLICGLVIAEFFITRSRISDTIELLAALHYGNMKHLLDQVLDLSQEQLVKLKEARNDAKVREGLDT